MAIPTFEDCMLPLLTSISNGEPRPIREIIADVANAFSLNEQERMETVSSGQRVIATRVGWARTYLKKAGLVSSPQRGMMSITDAGREVLAQKPSHLDTAYLRSFPDFKTWLETKRAVLTSQDGEPASPNDAMEAAYDAFVEQVADDLLEKLKTGSAYFLEKVVVKLLEEMGYGGVGGRGLVTQKSHDGGIDGVIYEDKLGLDSVCIQAKRWQGTVGRKTVQEFVGSMDLYRSRKGVILTTSSFSSEALTYVKQIEGKKVVLICGAELARLMIEYGVGCTVTGTYKTVQLSEDFFDEDT